MAELGLGTGGLSGPPGPPTSSTPSSPVIGGPVSPKSGGNAVTGMLQALSNRAVQTSVDALIKFVNAITTAGKNNLGGTNVAGGSTQNRIANQVAQSQQGTNTRSLNGGTFQNFMGGFTGYGAGGKGAGAGAAASGALQFGSMALAGVDNRINNMYGRALSYDKLSVLYQQTQGISQNRFASAVLQPLTQYRLGQGGASALLGLQAQTGLKANLNASSVEAMRTATGFAYSAQDMSQMMATLASPMVNNRMSMTIGSGMYGPGGSQRNMMQVIQQVVRGAGLTSERVVRSGMQMGSITRARLSALGLPEDMQNMVLQYAQSNIEYQKKGGGGMYDPSRAQDRKLMGIEKNFATQREETERVSDARDAQFYKRQADNYAQLEKNTQGLIKMFAALEDTLQGVIGARISTRNNRGLALAKTIGGIGLAIGGAALTPVSGPLGAAMVAGGVAMAGSGMGGFSGDPMPQGDTRIKIGYGGKKVRMDNAMGNSTISKLHPTFRERLMQMIQDNPRVGIGEGFRNPDAQRKLFLSRYSKTTEKTGIFWEGSYWKKNANVADAAPPGLSMHEIGLAADLTGDIAWVQKNAEKYGLKTFAGVNNEPWHVQPAELPNDRVSYEKNGAKWGMNGTTSKADPNTVVQGMTDGIVSDKYSGASTGNASGNKALSMSQVSIMDSISATREMNRAGLGAGAGGGSVGKYSVRGGKDNASGMKRGGKIAPKELAEMLYKQGFRGDDLAKALAVAYRESGFNSGALNNNPSTGDYSLGLFQINMHPKLRASRMKAWRLKSTDDLYDPATNIRIAHQMYLWNKGHGRDPFYDWGPHNNKDAVRGSGASYYPKAQALAKEVTSGDPMPMSRGARGSGAVMQVDGSSINLTVPINISGGGTVVDTHKVASEAARIIERELKIAMMRRT